MPPKEASPTPKDKPKTIVEKVNFLKPIYLVFDQTGSKNHFDVCATAEIAHNTAKEKATRTGRKVAVLGPQIAVYEPPSSEAVPAKLPFAPPD